MPPKKGLKGIKGTQKANVKKTVQPMSDSDYSESLLGPETPSQRSVSEHVEGEEGEEASERPVPEATQEEADPDEDDGAPTRKRAHVSDALSVAQEQDLADFFSDNPLFYDQTLKDFTNCGKRDHMLDTKERDGLEW